MFICGCRVANPWIDGGVSEAVLDSLFGDKYRDFLQLPQLISNFRRVDHAANVKKLMRRPSKLKKLVDISAFVGGSVLEN